MVLAALVIAAALVWWKLLGAHTGEAEVFEMPGAVSKELGAGEWALYSEEVGGSQRVANEDEITVEGPADVAVAGTSGFVSDLSEIDVDGTTYDVFARMRIDEAGTYVVTIAGDTTAGTTPVVLGPYTDSDGRSLVTGVVVVLAVLLGGLGLLVLVVGLVLRARGRRTPG
ncbi:MAG: hypothetical protein JWO76_803 [Nocardioides sp.]|nr:hypothetical protein [Nocardioides sp.]